MELNFSSSIRFIAQYLSSHEDNFSFAFIVVLIVSRVYIVNETCWGGWITERSQFESRQGREFSISHIIQTGSEIHPTSYLMGTGVFAREKSGKFVKLTTHLQPVPRPRKRGCTYPLPCIPSWRIALLYPYFYCSRFVFEQYVRFTK
jgi:hypothetical protein